VSLGDRVLDALKAPLRPVVRRMRGKHYAVSYERAVTRAREELGRPLVECRSIDFEAEPEELWRRMGEHAPERLRRMEVSLAEGRVARETGDYWRRYSARYDGIGAGREKALEHSLTFALLDFGRVRRFCDLAAATSPIEFALAADWDSVEYWKQDLLYETDLGRRVVGGLAQAMDGIEPGFFDALTLHCSYEHFENEGDVELLAELDRVLSPHGACLIVPLYVAHTHRVYFDPTMVATERAAAWDDAAELRTLFNYRQEHGRFYSPESLAERVLARIPSTLEATLLRFRGQESVDPGIYIQFGLVLHRPDSILRGET